MDKKLLQTVVCPQCHHELQWQKSEQTLNCDVCALAFPVKDGIPVLLVEEANTL